jgi:hypothetical protein
MEMQRDLQALFAIAWVLKQFRSKRDNTFYLTTLKDLRKQNRGQEMDTKKHI